MKKIVNLPCGGAFPLFSMTNCTVCERILSGIDGMQCSICHFGNPEGARFCNQCGTFLYATAHADFSPPSLDEKLARLQRYLPQGLTQKILHQRDAIEGERRQVTVMFCDMEGFTAFADRLGEEATYTVMGQIYEILIRQVNDYEGTINEMTGDGIMALFGAPIALEDAAPRALWAARAIHREMALFSKMREGLDPVRMRIGIHSGPVVVGSLGNDLRVEFKAVGDTVNLASRMESLAQPGTTYVTHEVYKQAREMFEFENLGKKIIKGKGESIPVYKLLPGRKDIRRPRLGSERLLFSEMVGRQSKLDKLELQVAKLINGAGSVANIFGEAGIGKSRLLAELKQREIMQRVLLLEGRAVSMGRNLSFHPIVNLLKQWAYISVDDGASEAFIKLDIAVRELFQEQAGDVLPFVATLMGLTLPVPYRRRLEGVEGESLEKMIRKNMRDLFARLSQTRPLVIVIDDLHWSDKSSIELLESLFRLAEKERVLFIHLFRPDHEETGQRILDTCKARPSLHSVEIPLDPLGPRKSEILIANVLNFRGGHHTVVDQIIQRAGGNPYFIEEVVRSFIDEGAVVVKGGKLEVTPKLNQVTIPNTINDVLMARIDRLEQETHDLLKVAAVIGRSFFYRILSVVADSVTNLDDRLSYLKETQLIRERKRMEELEYLFNHALAQEVTYASILPERCKALHLKVADTIEKVFAKKLHAFYGMLAFHYSRAEHLEKAEDALVKAGEEALKSSASSEALHYYMEALRLYRQQSSETADPSKVARLEKNIALALYNRGQYEEAIEYFDRSLAYYWGKAPIHPVSNLWHIPYSFFHLLVALYLPFTKLKKTPTAHDCEAIDLYYKKCQALVVIYPQRFFIESFYFYKRFTKFDFRHFPTGPGMFISASSMFTFTGLSFGLGRRIMTVAQSRLDREDARQMITHDLLQTSLNYFAGYWNEINGHDDDLVKRNLAIGEFYSVSLHYYWHGFPKLYQGDLPSVEWLVDRLSDIAEVYENDFSLLFKHLLNVALLMESRRLPEGLAEIRAGIEIGKKSKSGLSLIHFYGCQAQIYLLMDNDVAAKKALDTADRIRSEEETVPWVVSVFCRSQAELWLYRFKDAIIHGRKLDVPKLRRRALKSCRALLRQTRKVAQHRTEACRLMGVYYWLNGKAPSALKWWRKSIRTGERLGARIQLSRSYFEVGQRLQERGSPDSMLDGITAQAYIDKAEALFKEMNLDWDLERLHCLPKS
jgi:class 3 adenylate cyclase/tetratricopeptide (TPR) repeat protein